MKPDMRSRGVIQISHLARMEIRITFEELLSRGIGFELDGPVERLRSNFFNGIKRMPVRVTS